MALATVVTTQDQLIERIGKHYRKQAVSELYKLMGTADLRKSQHLSTTVYRRRFPSCNRAAVGNPIGLVGGVASGVVDFFYEPGAALFRDPSEFGSALGKGTMALVGGTIGGSMNTVSKMTGLRIVCL